MKSLADAQSCGFDASLGSKATPGSDGLFFCAKKGVTEGTRGSLNVDLGPLVVVFCIKAQPKVLYTRRRLGFLEP